MKIAFASICMEIDFDSKEEAEEYIKKMQGKNWWFGEIHEMLTENKWTLEIRKPYKNYNGGW